MIIMSSQPTKRKPEEENKTHKRRKILTKVEKITYDNGDIYEVMIVQMKK